MANSLTYLGERTALMGDADVTGPTGPVTGPTAGMGGVVSVGVKIKLYTTGSTPAQDGSGFVEVTGANGYTTGGKTIRSDDWTYASGAGSVTLDDQTWTAGGGTIPDIKGAYLTDKNDNILAWWERGTGITLQIGDSITLDDLDITLS